MYGYNPMHVFTTNHDSTNRKFRRFLEMGQGTIVIDTPERPSGQKVY